MTRRFHVILTIFTARCTTAQSAFLRSHVVCPSVCLSVTLVDFWLNSMNSKIIARLVSVGRSLSADPKHHGSTPRGATGNLGPKWPTPVDLSVGDIRSQIAAEWLQIAQRSQWRAYRKPPSLFRMVPSLTPYDLPFPQNGVPYCPMIREWS